MHEIKLEISDSLKTTVSGSGESYFQLLESKFKVQIISRGDGLTLRGQNQDSLEGAKEIILKLSTLVKKGETLEQFQVENLLSNDLKNNQEKAIFRNRFGQGVYPKTPGQKELVKAIKKNDIVFAKGPAGTGKTFLAIAHAIATLEEGLVDRIALVRPAVEAGENLGFLPGDLEEKITPYLRPLYDAIQELLPAEKIQYYQDANSIEVAPLAYMRGRTLKRAFIILDEAQNTTVSQMKMFLTRVGPSSQVIITGDTSQIDLPNNQKSGLDHAINILNAVEGIGVVKLTSQDVMRHNLVQEIIEAYEKYE